MPIIDKLDALLVLPPKEFSAAVSQMKDFTKHERSDLMKNSDVAEAWVGRMNRELVSGSVDTVKAMTQLGDQLLAVLIEKPKNLMQTNICECFTKWIKAASLRKLKHANDILTLTMVILESPEIATEIYEKIAPSLTKLVVDNQNSVQNINVARNAAETLMLGHCDIPANRKYVDVVKVVDTFKATHDIPLRETLLVIIRKCIVKNTVDSTAKSKATANLLKIMTREEYKSIENTGATETGTLDFVCKMAEKDSSGPVKILRATSASINGKLFPSKVIVFVTKTYLTYQQPNEIRWIDILLDSVTIKEKNSKAVTITTSNNTISFATTEPRTWIQAITGVTSEPTAMDIDDDDDEDEVVCRKSIRRTNKKQKRSLPRSPPKDVQSDDDYHVKRQKSMNRLPTESLMREPSRMRPSYKPLAEKWVPPEDLFLGKEWMDSEDEEDDQQEMEKMQMVLSSCLEKKEKAQIQELEEVSKEIQHMTDRHIKEQEVEMEELSSILKKLEEDVRRQETMAQETSVGEKKITRDVMSVHSQFVQTVRIAKREFQEISADLDDILPCNEDLNNQIMNQIDTMTKRGLALLQKKAKKRSKKSDTVMKMFGLITQEFSAAR
eukprot:TRINITY_DN4653_c1_g1_i1.p1 TRINITY_DN4653_c1_g1~~TRINITY_DN4653_c1_g1_i1.p1  ORF type:complete len:625 (+),score=151.71 TRINITY_DN4653_c1_g1_i1:47-1876(+)